MAHESLIHALDAVLHELPFGGTERPHPDGPEYGHAQIGRRIGLGYVDRNAQLVAERLLAVEYQSEHADRPGQRDRRSHDGIGGTRNVISARSRHISHRNDHRALLADLLDLVPDHFGSQRAAARTVHA